MITLWNLTWFSLAAPDYGSNDTLPTFSAAEQERQADGDPHDRGHECDRGPRYYQVCRTCIR
jgi:hypothetical protein